MKSDKLKKIENEIHDLEQWLKLGLVPKKDIDKHRDEIRIWKTKLSEEKKRIQLLKETGEVEEYVTPKRQVRATFSDSQGINDLEMPEEAPARNLPTVNVELETENVDLETAVIEENDDEETIIVEDDDDPFSDKNRWKRGIADPEADDNW